MKWPGERDSNPRRCDPQRFSRPPLSTTQPSPALETIKKKYVELGGDTQIRTGESRLCRPMPYHLAMSPPLTLTLYQIKFINAPRTNEKFSRWCPRPDLNRYRRNVRGILSPLCLPISPPGLIPKRNPNALQIQKTYYKNEIALWILVFKSIWSGRRGSNPRPQPWQGCALPLSYSRV